MFPGQVKTVIYYADTGVRMGGRCMPEEIMLEELRGLLGEKSSFSNEDYLQNRYTSVTNCDTMICDVM